MPIRQDNITPTVTPELTSAFERTISGPRLQPYLVAAGRDHERALRLYLWNVRVGQSFHFPIQTTEVALRNCINECLQAEFGHDWWSSAGFLKIASPERIQDISAVEKRIENRKLHMNVDQIVASLTFGFWVGMLHGSYNPKFWSKHLRRAFPYLPEDSKRERVHAAADQILGLRNRIFHHEPLLRRNLTSDYGALLKLLGWMCPETHRWVRAHSSVPVVLRQRP